MMFVFLQIYNVVKSFIRYGFCKCLRIELHQGHALSLVPVFIQDQKNKQMEHIKREFEILILTESMVMVTQKFLASKVLSTARQPL